MSLEKSDHLIVVMKPGNAGGAKGGDKLKSSDSRQLAFVFADNPIGSDDVRNADESAGRAYLLHKADVKETTESDAETIDTSRLLEQFRRPRNNFRCFETVSLKSRMWAHKSGSVRGLGDYPGLVNISKSLRVELLRY